MKKICLHMNIDRGGKNPESQPQRLRNDELEQELANLKNRITSLNQNVHHWKTRTRKLTYQINVIYSTRSWRFTRPLSLFIGYLKSLPAEGSSLLKRIIALPKLILKSLVLTFINTAFANPGLKKRCLDFLEGLPRLKERLKTLAINNHLLENSPPVSMEFMEENLKEKTDKAGMEPGNINPESIKCSDPVPKSSVPEENLPVRIEVKIDNTGYLLESDDQYLKNAGENFEPNMVELFKKLIGPDFVIADIGANIGFTSILFSQLGSKVFSFEPSPTTYNYLVKNLRNNHLENVIPVNQALGDKNTTSTLTYSNLNRSGGFVSDKVRPREGHTTENIIIRRFDDVWHQYADELDFLKIDVEGFESQVINGSEKLISKYKPIIVMELNHWCLNAFQRITVPDFLDFLRERFPYLYAVDSKNQSIKDLHNEEESYLVMHSHITEFEYPNLVAGFNPDLKTRLEF
jgi:FkbM family methyltransferase